MGSIEVFMSQTQSSFAILALVMMFFACIYSTSGQDRLFAPLWLFFAGVLLDLGANGIASFVSSVYSIGENINFYVFSELLLSLVSMLFMVLSAVSFTVSGNVVLWLSIILGGLGLLAISLFVFLIPDGDIVNGMRQVFPLAGVASAMLGFWGQVKGRHKSGFILSALIMTTILSVMLLRIVGIDISNTKYITSVSYVLLSVTMIMMKVDYLNCKTDKYEIELANYNHKLEEIIRLSPFPIVISRLGDDKIVLANNNAVKLFGINPQEIERYKFKDFFADTDNRRLLNERLELEREIQDFEVLVKAPYSNVPFWLLVSANIIDYNYEPVLYTAFQDITSRKNRESLLQDQATRDPLTSIYNRRYFEEEVAKRISFAKMNRQPYAVLMLDADHFKKVNDNYGHKVGDKVLIELATTIEHALRDNDIIARYGGEEFVVYLADTFASQGINVAERLRRSIENVIVAADNGQKVKFTISIGVSSSDISDNIDVLIKTADAALYKAKQNGRNRVEIFTVEDLQQFDISNLSVNKDDNHNQHPIFDKENTEEISLLDGHIITPENLYAEGNIKEDDNELS